MSSWRAPSVLVSILAAATSCPALFSVSAARAREEVELVTVSCRQLWGGREGSVATIFRGSDFAKMQVLCGNTFS